MELAQFFRFVVKNISVLVLIPIITVIITYFLVRSLPDKYISQGQISTGMVDKSDEINLTDAPTLQNSEIEQKFSTLIQMMQMQNILSLLSYQLIIHDLSGANRPFKKFSNKVQDLTAQQKADVISTAQYKYKQKQVLSRSSKNDILLQDVLNSMKYDPGSLREGLKVSRIGQSDFISIEFESTDPDLSAFTVNTIANEFIKHYTSIVENTGQRSVTYLSDQLTLKQSDLDNKMKILKYYKIKNSVANLPEQEKILYGRIIDVQDRQAEVTKQITALSGAIKAIDNKFNMRDRRYFEAALSRVNADIMAYKEKTYSLNDKYIDNDFDPVYKRMVDSMANLTSSKVNEAADEYAFNPLAVKQDLIAKKINLQTELDLARNSVASLSKFHNTLYAQFSRLVPFEASIQGYERDIEIASQAYLDILNKYNFTSMQTAFIAKLKYSQPAGPGGLQPSKKMLLIILSGVISFVFCILVLFALFYFDDAIQSAKLLANKTALPVIGQLSLMPHSSLNIKNLWDEKSDKVKSKLFKDQLRAIRLELNQELKNSKILAITSIGPNEGKTFLALNLAYAYAVTNKKVLLMDGNFIHSELTNSLKPEGLTFIEDFLHNGELSQSEQSRQGITIIGNRGGDKSVFEITDEENTKQKLEQLKSMFDIILIETPALVATETSKEWILFSEKVIGVFEYKEYITESKKEQLIYLNSLDSKFIGWIFNKVGSDTEKKSWFKKL